MHDLLKVVYGPPAKDIETLNADDEEADNIQLAAEEKGA